MMYIVITAFETHTDLNSAALFHGNDWLAGPLKPGNITVPYRE